MGCIYGWESTGWMLLKTVCFVLASFVFSLIFWLTKRAVDRAPEPKKKKK